MKAVTGALLLASVLLAFPTGAATEGSLVLTYEAPTVEYRQGASWTRGPFLSAAAAGSLFADDRVDVGRLLANIPDGSTALTVDALDAVSQGVPLRFEWFLASGASAGATTLACPTIDEPVPVPVPAGARRAVIWVHAVDVTDMPPAGPGACPSDVVAGASKGTLTLTFA